MESLFEGIDPFGETSGKFIDIDDSGNLISESKEKSKEEEGKPSPKNSLEEEIKDFIPAELFEQKPESKSNNNGEDEPLEDEESLKGGEASSADSVSPVALYLKAEGVLPNFDEEEYNKLETKEDRLTYLTDQFGGVRETLKNQAIEDVKRQLPEFTRKQFEAVLAGADLEEYAVVQSKQQKYNSISDSDLEGEENETVELRKQILFQDFVNRGYSESKAKSLAQRSVDSGNDEEDAKEALKDLKVLADKEEQDLLQKVQDAKAQEKKNLEQYANSLSEFVNDTSEIIPGVNLSDKTKSAVISNMMSKETNKANQLRNKNAAAFDFALHYYVEQGLFNFDKDGNFNPDFSKLKIKKSKEHLDALEKALEPKPPSGTPRSGMDTRRKDDNSKLNKELEGLRKSLGI